MPALVPNRRNTVPLPSPAPLGQPVHGQLVRPLLSQHLAGGGQQEPPVAGGVGALGGFGPPGHLLPGHLFPRQRGLVHGFTLRSEY